MPSLGWVSVSVGAAGSWEEEGGSGGRADSLWELLLSLLEEEEELELWLWEELGAAEVAGATGG